MLVRGGPVVPRAQAQACVLELRAATTTAERHVRAITGLGEELPLQQGEVVDRPGWVSAASDGLSALTGGSTGTERARLRQVMAGGAGVQAGMVLAFLASRVLGQYDPFGAPGGTLLLVAPNVIGAERALDVPTSDFRLWVCLHECTHRLQFTAVPWLRDYFAGQVASLMVAMDVDDSDGGAAKLGELVRTVGGRVRSGEGLPDAMGILELLRGPEQREVLDRLLALSTLLEGHADHVMDAAGPSVVPSVAVIRQRFTERRRGGGLLDRLLRGLLGVDAKIRQYEQGAAFTRHVVGAVGMNGFNAVWQSQETLPTMAEITDPAGWLRRVHG
ncbi:MAG: zinc-dependent metalloprotease [Sciscionella sp.]